MMKNKNKKREAYIDLWKRARDELNYLNFSLFLFTKIYIWNLSEKRMLTRVNQAENHLLCIICVYK
jgi:hypothetical protein